MNEKEIKAKIEKLVEDYNNTDPQTSEANIEANLVSKLFKILGWDKDNIRVYDRNSYVRGAGFPDVALKIDDEPVIFMEVKKIGKIPKNRIDPQVRQAVLPFKELQHLIDRTPEEKQAMRYARAKEIPWAILTNFECLFVFNADHDRIILSFKSPDEYLSRFEDLWRLSKERVEAKSLEWLQDQIKKEPIDKNFLEKLKNWRLSLAQNIYNNNKDNKVLLKEDGNFNFEELMHIVQRILSRLLVISIADDMEVLETQNILENIYKGYEDAGEYVSRDHLLTRFNEISHSMDKHHNTTIFAPGHPCENVKVSNDVFASVLKELCHISFRRMSVDILGATYESYLGYVFQMKNGRITAEIDARVRKQAGIYYTPTYIVHYIVDNTLGKMLEEIEEKEGIKAIEKVKDIKVLDPACGSGSFLIYAFDVFAEFYDRVNKRITDEQFNLSKGHANPSMFDQLEQFKNLPKQVLEYPKKILEDHLYGVDLDPAAAEIATINLVIKAFEKMKGKKLPLILNQNIKVGNSLISGIRKKEDLDDFKREFDEHINLRKKLKQTVDENEKQKIMNEINDLQQKVNSRLNESLKNHFDNTDEKRPFNWQFEFPEAFQVINKERGLGFDVVIGNPPYVRIHKIPKEEITYFRKFYNSAKQFFDLFCLMIERGLYLAKLKGRFSFIVPSLFLKGFQYKILRKFILQSTEKHFIKDFGDGVFAEVEMPTCVFNFTKGTHTKKVIQEPYDLISEKTDLPIKVDTIKLEEITDSMRGLEVGKDLVSESSMGKDFRDVISGDEIGRYVIKTHKKIRLKDVKTFAKDNKYFRSPRLLIRETGGELTATFQKGKLYSLRTIFSFISIKESRYNLKYILGIINSKFCQKIYEIKYKTDTQIFPKIRLAQTRVLPLPHVDFSKASEKAKHNQLVKYVNIMLDRNKQRNEITRIFTQVLRNHSYELKSLGIAYYDRAEYVEKIDKKASSIANSEKEVTKIFVKEKGKLLFFYVFIDNKWEQVLILKIIDDYLRFFLFYSLHKYLEENKRRKKWTTKSFPKVMDVLLGRLEVPVFKTQAKIYDIKYNLKMIGLVIKEFKSKFRKKFPKGIIHLSQIEEQIQDTDNSIDALVFKLYGLNKEEVTTVLDSMKVEKEIKEDILKKFKKR